MSPSKLTADAVQRSGFKIIPNFKRLNTFQSHFWTGDHIISTLIGDLPSEEVFNTSSSVSQEILEVFPAGTGDKSL